MNILILTELILIFTVFSSLFPKNKLKFIIAPGVIFLCVFCLLGKFGFLNFSIALLDGISYILFVIILLVLIREVKLLQKRKE